MSRVLYEVTLRVQPDIAEAYLVWLHEHVAQMLALPGFLEASVWRVTEPAPADDGVEFCCHYTLRDAAALDAYLAGHAPHMRAEGQRRFGGKFTAQRRVLAELAAR